MKNSSIKTFCYFTLCFLAGKSWCGKMTNFRETLTILKNNKSDSLNSKENEISNEIVNQSRAMDSAEFQNGTLIDLNAFPVTIKDEYVLNGRVLIEDQTKCNSSSCTESDDRKNSYMGSTDATSKNCMSRVELVKTWMDLKEDHYFHCQNCSQFGACCVCSCDEENIIADCSHANLTYIPNYLPEDITRLWLTNNHLNNNSLNRGALSKYSLLEDLQLNKNNISALPNGAFEGLNNLRILNLQKNSLAMDRHLQHSKVFAPLHRSLKLLLLNGNNHNILHSDLEYPDVALSVLVNLSYLYMDGLYNKSLGRRFSSLRKLTNLTLSGYYPGYCFMGSIRNHTFEHVPYVRFLNISDCGLNGSLIEKNTFAPLKELEILDLSNNFFLGLEAVGDLMYGIRNSRSIRHLRMQRVVPRFAPCVVIYKHTLRYFKNMSLEIIEAMYNEIEMIQLGAIELLPASLRFVNLTSNKIMFGSYWKNMGALINLENLHLDGFFNPVNFPYVFPEDDFQCKKPPKDGTDMVPNLVDYPCVENNRSESDTNFTLPLPPKLRNVTMQGSSVSYNIVNMSFCPNNSLEYVDLSSNHFPTLGGPMTGLSKLRILNLSSCYIQTITDKFFDNLTDLEHLNLFQNLLADHLNLDEGGLIFDKLSNIRTINISFNSLYRLTRKIFQNMARVEVIDLSINRLSHVNFSITHMHSLRLVDLHRNNIMTLPPHFTAHVDWLLGNGINVTIDMRQNPIMCDCENLHFLQWVVERGVFGDNFSNYYCRLPLSSKDAREMKEGYEEMVQHLTHQCTENVEVFIIVGCATLLTVLILIGTVVYRFRWTLRYWYHAGKMKISANRRMDRTYFKYDVFVSYSNSDIDFVLKELCPKLKERNIKILIHGEKFKVGRYISDNIYKAIVKCRKTLVVITSGNLASHWCNYELQMARQESVSTGRNVLVFLFLEEIPSSKLGPQVLSHIKSSTYITYPKLSQHRGAFWDKLADDLRSA